uniref:Putative lis1-interacting protein nude n=1 Tax=Tabanus bromius TaxID=304241 RepID=A0A0K8TUG3_TABBR
MEAVPNFSSVEDECRYWKERAKLYHKEWSETKQEFDEFVEDSRQLEAEMETTLEQKENIIKDLRKQVMQLEHENESLRIKLDSFGIDFANLEKQLTTTQREKENMKSYLRQLEQKNDDLERAHRILSESIAGIETMLDKAYEKNALLESEVDEKEVLQEKLQRLMDETRDLKQELNVKSRPNPGEMNGIMDKCLGNADASRSEAEPQTPASAKHDSSQSQHSIKHPDNLINGNAMTASSRTTALNIVADMLRKLNLDKTLLCSRCDKFRCICQRPIENNLSASTSSVSSAGGSSSFTSASNFGSNVLKRLTQRVSGITTESQSNAMESKLKAYREHNVPAPRQ